MAESFVEFLGAWGQAHPPGMTHSPVEPFGEWQQRFGEAVDSLRGPLPDRVEPVAETVESVEADGHTRHRLRIPVSEVSTLVAYLLVPHGIADGERRPGLIVSHGHSKRGIDDLAGVRGQGSGTGLRAVRDGYVCLLPAWWGWHGRNGHLAAAGKGRDPCNVIQMAAAMYGLNVLDLHIQDGGAALDVLAARPEVDPDRLGCLGNSYGGRTTMWLALFDQRIRAAVSAGAMNTFRERSLKLSSCGIQYLPGLLRYGDVPELYSLIAPRALQLQAGEGDGLITPADRDHIADVVRRAYRSLGVEDHFDYVLHGEGHKLLWEHAAPFLAKHLGGQ